MKNVSNIEYNIAKWYIYLLPIRMVAQLIWLSDALHGAGIYFDVILHAIGVFLVWTRRGSLSFIALSSRKLFKYFLHIVLFCNFTSILMAGITQLSKGSYGTETAFEGILGMQIYFIQYIFMLYYNIHVFNILGKSQILKILNRVCDFLLLLGYVQIGCIMFPGIRNIVISLDFLGILLPPGETWYKLCLTGSEGAAGGTLLSCFIYPILFAQYLVRAEKKILYRILLFLPVLFFTNSSTAYLLFVVSILMFFKYFCSQRFGNLFVGLIVFFVVYLGYDTTNSKDISSNKESIYYLLFDKALDRDNGSTATRTVPFYINLGAFSESPIIGVGNGLQGYYYKQYFPMWTLQTAGSDVGEFYNRAQYTIANGAVFFLGLLSGYGLVGMFLFLRFFFLLIKLAKQYKEQLNVFYYIFMLAIFSIILCGFQGDFWGLYYIWFIISLPLMVRVDKL